MNRRKRKKQIQRKKSFIKNQNIQQVPTENREFKDCLFKKVFEKREDLLQLYNAVNGTNYKDPEELEVNTLEDVVYLGIKNDKSFLIGGMMNLYEHQSTYNPNVPIRGLLYFARLYEQYLEMKKIRLYGSSQIKLPVPQFIVFYNGTREEPENEILRLSDAFDNAEVEPALECKAIMLNINYGHNNVLMEKCWRLKEYSIFVATVRTYLDKGCNSRIAVMKAVDECIDKNVLRDILVKNKAEVVSMILTSFNQEEYEQTIRDESYEEGIKVGLKALVESCKELGATKELIVEKIVEKYKLSTADAEMYVEKYWE